MLEKDIENLIARYPDEFFPFSGFKLVGQQIRLGRCKADIIFTDKFDRKVIVEVKRGILSRDAAGQIMEYYGLLKNEQPESIIELILCANIIPNERRRFLETSGIECNELGIALINSIASKYSYEFLDQKSNHLERVFEGLEQISENEKVWVFQGNPNRYDVLNALSDTQIGLEKHWLVNQHKNEIKSGHLGLIWLSGREAGIYALTKIISDPQFLFAPPEEEKYWIDSIDSGKSKLRVKMKILMNLITRPIYKSELKNTFGLENLSIFRYSQGTNFPVSLDEWELIKRIILNKKT